MVFKYENVCLLHRIIDIFPRVSKLKIIRLKLVLLAPSGYGFLRIITLANLLFLAPARELKPHVANFLTLQGNHLP